MDLLPYLGFIIGCAVGYIWGKYGK